MVRTAYSTHERKAAHSEFLLKHGIISAFGMRATLTFAVRTKQSPKHSSHQLAPAKGSSPPVQPFPTVPSDNAGDKQEEVEIVPIGLNSTEVLLLPKYPKPDEGLTEHKGREAQLDPGPAGPLLECFILGSPDRPAMPFPGALKSGLSGGRPC